MGHRNIQFNGHMIDMQADQSHSHLHPEPCIFYASAPNFPHHNIHPVVPTPGNQCSLNFHPIPERHDNALFYAVPPYNGVQPQHNLDLNLAAPSGHYNPYFPVQVNHGAHNLSHVDGIRGPFKRKNAEGPPSNYQYQNVSAGSSSSSVAPMARPTEPDISQTNAASFMPTEYAGNDPASTVEIGSLRSVRNRAGIIQGNYVAPPVLLPGNPWLDMNYGAHNGDVGALAWTQPPNLPYVHANMNGACVEAGNIGVQGYQVPSISRGAGFLCPPVAQGHSNPQHPTPPIQGMRGYNVNQQMATSSRSTPTFSYSSTGINHFQDVVDDGPTFLAPVPPTGFRLYRPHRREIILDANSRNRNLPHLRVLPEDEVAMLEIPGYHVARDSIDQHSDMRLDIDHMSYEELLALGEQIGSVGTGLSEEFIQNNLKIRTYTSMPARVNLEYATCPDQQKINFCVVCQRLHKEVVGREEYLSRMQIDSLKARLPWRMVGDMFYTKLKLVHGLTQPLEMALG
ncbi:hypothetical protein DH2020_011597 [Rehmannia glutinosa]|uniref:RING-type E3 ubiquitin transferase n=1 Tax=Rehmannia glutinosa TaxID=99300 RepID=A0ABR0XDX3_REHGL